MTKPKKRKKLKKLHAKIGVYDPKDAPGLLRIMLQGIAVAISPSKPYKHFTDGAD